MNSFNPTKWHFIKLKKFEFPGSISIYEYQNHPTVDGKPNFLRMNIYLTKHRNFITIWRGLVETIFTETRTASFMPKNFDFNTYNENLFRGYIDTEDEAKHILHALRIGTGKGIPLPQLLSAGSDNKPRWDVIDNQA